jgi:putative nucleotidyltransferase with HDIG domain
VKEALDMLDQPRIALAELEEVILKDQVLSARILRIANSAFIGMERRVGRIFDALSLLGFTMIRALLVGAALKDMHRQLGPTEKTLWEHSIGVSLAAAMIAKETGLVPPETALVSGLLHDIGRTAINNSTPKGYADVIRKERECAGETIVLEREAFGYTHCDVGGAIGDAWKFPKAITAAIRRHHRGSDTEERSASGNGHARLCNVVTLADELCLHMGIGLQKLPAVSDDLVRDAGISAERFVTLADDFRNSVSEQIGYFMG